MELEKQTKCSGTLRKIQIPIKLVANVNSRNRSLEDVAGVSTVKELWELLLSSLSTPLRQSLLIVSGILTLIVFATKTIFQMEYQDIFQGSYLLTGIVVAALFLAVQFFRYSPQPWSYISLVAFLIIAGGAAVASWRAWQFTYDPRGFSSQREWKIVKKSGTNTDLSLRVIATSNAPANLIFHVETIPDVCPQASFRNLHPVLPPHVELRGTETGEQLSSSRQFTFEGFRRPAEITFRLTISNAGPENIATCFSHSIDSNGKSPETSDKEK